MNGQLDSSFRSSYIYVYVYVYVYVIYIFWEENSYVILHVIKVFLCVCVFLLVVKVH